MADRGIEGSGSTLSTDKSASTALPRSLKAASSILKSLSSLSRRKSDSSNLPSGSKSVRSAQKSVSILADDKFFPKDSSSVVKNESKNYAEGIESESAVDDKGKEKIISVADLDTGNTITKRKRMTKFMRKYPELFRDDVSINPSYTGLRNFPYNVVCRQRFHKNKLKINRQLNKEIETITMMQTLALDGVRVERIFSVGFHPSKTIVSDFATPSERLRLNRILCER